MTSSSLAYVLALAPLRDYLLKPPALLGDTYSWLIRKAPWQPLGVFYDGQPECSALDGVMANIV
ncbi:hypothetical protein GCM10009304_23540 [Pseudomonas matsuisoli]|uniref:Uncharacterized protein n=2 Tax=Pseudomonas matsuisoli TaxID=1515666 RepID=A0A917PX73_9PSED|nr:hypothetical protein GCM10009304_23540 [Pseudomonas matsuisoli]